MATYISDFLHDVLTGVELAEYWYIKAHQTEDTLTITFEKRSWEELFLAAERGEI